MKRSILLAALVLLVSPLAAEAQTSGVELTLFAGYRSQGDFNVVEAFDDLFEPGFEIDEGDVVGAILDIPLGQHLMLEFLYSRQDSELLREGGLFDPEERISDIEVTYIQAGVQYQWTPGQLRPFIGAALGAAVLDPDASVLDQETKLSGSFGGGLKVFFGDHFGLRLEGRALWANLDEADFDDRCRRNCDHGDDDLFQVEATAGIVFKF